MKEYFISEIDIEKLYHLSDIKIKVHQKIQDSRYSRILQQRELDDKLKEWFRKNIIVVGDRKIFESD